MIFTAVEFSRQSNYATRYKYAMKVLITKNSKELKMPACSSKYNVVPWRNGEDAGLVFQGLVVRAPPQEIFHSNSGIAVLQ